MTPPWKVGRIMMPPPPISDKTAKPNNDFLVDPKFLKGCHHSYIQTASEPVDL